MFLNLKIHCTVCVIGANHILYAKNAPTAPIFEYLVLRSNCLYPYLLGFDSNLIPNMHNFNISAISQKRIPNIRSNQEIFVYIYVHCIEKIAKYLGNSLALVYFSCRIQQGPLLLMRNIPNTCFISDQCTSSWEGIP